MSTPLPLPPMTAGLSNVTTADAYGHWLLEVARVCADPEAIDRAIGLEWPGTPEQRALRRSHNAALGLDCSCHICTARKFASQLASETWAKERKDRQLAKERRRA